jgi:hypothetical protein
MFTAVNIWPANGRILATNGLRRACNNPAKKIGSGLNVLFSIISQLANPPIKRLLWYAKNLYQHV